MKFLIVMSTTTNRFLLYLYLSLNIKLHEDSAKTTQNIRQQFSFGGYRRRVVSGSRTQNINGGGLD